ncbi:restriction endonuclease [Brunnivagina elsteri]|uniref:Restriction endonuclease n=1 Tax=Brunnivagina elsteri CCALA 953 TaxID=987040 RepID=A0A2A2THI5_9CYAN|nr:restriction endonuclease [Calothrix elsteri]PAX53210.1 restriction endonuclease [Calothrix elsteri CCALA 953]
MIPLILGAAAVLGAVIYGVNESERKDEEKRILNSGIREVDEMSGKEFEKLLSLLFKNAGYQVKLTPGSQDYGADLVLYKDGEKIVVQAKRYKNPVSVKAVQEIVSAVKYYNADKAMVITNNRFTGNAYNLARSNSVELWDRNKLIDFMIKAKIPN